MVPLKIILALCATVLFNFSLARPRATQSPRFPKFSENSVGEFVLWSCTATAQLQKKNNVDDNNIIKIVPASVDVPTNLLRISSNSHSAGEGDARINNINIIKVNRIPYRNRGRPDGVPKKSTLQNIEKNSDQGARHKNVAINTADSPLKTIKVNSFGKDMPVIFKEKSHLPEIGKEIPMKKVEIPQHSSEITVIKPYDGNFRIMMGSN